MGMRRVRNALFELGVAPGECKVFLTHTHFDHAEAARVLFPEGTCVYVSEVGFEERSPIRAEAARELFVRRMLKMGATLADAEEYSRNDYEPTFLPAGAFDLSLRARGRRGACGALRVRRRRGAGTYARFGVLGGA